MNSTAIFINFFVIFFMIVSLLKDKDKTKKAIIIAGKSLLKILPSVLMIIMFIGLLLGLLPQAKISEFIGEQSGWE